MTIESNKVPRLGFDALAEDALGAASRNLAVFLTLPLLPLIGTASLLAGLRQLVAEPDFASLFSSPRALGAAALFLFASTIFHAIYLVLWARRAGPHPENWLHGGAPALVRRAGRYLGALFIMLIAVTAPIAFIATRFADSIKTLGGPFTGLLTLVIALITLGFLARAAVALYAVLYHSANDVKGGFLDHWHKAAWSLVWRPVLFVITMQLLLGLAAIGLALVLKIFFEADKVSFAAWVLQSYAGSLISMLGLAMVARLFPLETDPQ